MLLQDTIQDALDELASSRSSSVKKGAALDTLERLLAQLCTRSILNDEAEYTLRYFVALQDTFQCNVPSRLLSWITESTARLETLISKGCDNEKDNDLVTLASQLIQALSIIQGVALNHPPSKQWLGRRYPLHTLLDLFMASRHVSFTNSSSSSSSQSKSSPPSLSSAVLDTLLCILVDSSPALRVFESVNGVQYVVKILKRAGTPREVRMKCLEFLYFYLLDETNSPSNEASLPTPTGRSTPINIPTAPNSPSSLNTSTNTSTRSITSSTDLSDSPSSSYSSTSSTWDARTTSSIESCESSTYATSFSGDSFDGSSTPVESSPTPAPKGTASKPSRLITPPSAQPRSLLMLRKDVDFIPTTPKKAQISKLGVGMPRVSSLARTSSKPSTQDRKERGEREVFMSRTNQEDTPIQRHARMRSLQSLETPVKLGSRTNLNTPTTSSKSLLSPPHSPPPVSKPFQKGHRRGQSSIDTQGLRTSVSPALPVIEKNGARTMEEKKEILGGLLGNVDALVEGVRKAGIWGLN
ncbi:hypothetical protein QCA50_014852 [Cerrena zonata]|uniref:Cell division control protein 14 n=1 Tax=Cerrena zonata TaxID=2478898 RepID=A0AAW0FSP2_9APHY